MLLATALVTFLCGVQLPNHKIGDLTCIAEDKLSAPGLHVVVTEHQNGVPRQSAPKAATNPGSPVTGAK